MKYQILSLCVFLITLAPPLSATSFLKVSTDKVTTKSPSGQNVKIGTEVTTYYPETTQELRSTISNLQGLLKPTKSSPHTFSRTAYSIFLIDAVAEHKQSETFVSRANDIASPITRQDQARLSLSEKKDLSSDNLEQMGRIANQIKGSKSQIPVYKSSVPVPEHLKLQKTQTKSPYDKTEKRINLAFTVIRGISASGALALTLVITSGISPLYALPVGLVVGAMSAGFQYHNQKFLAWISSNGWLSISPTQIAPIWQSIAKQYLTGCLFTTVIRAGMAMVGIGGEFFALEVVKDILVTTGKGMFASSLWDNINSRVTKESNIKKPEKVALHSLLSNTASFFMATTIIAVQTASLLKFNIADVTMGVLGVTGAIAFVWRYGNLKSLIPKMKNAKDRIWRNPCRRLWSRNTQIHK